MDLLFTATPHIAGYSLDGKANGTTMSVQAIARKFNLPCKDWHVTDIPLPAQDVCFTIDVTGKTAAEIIQEAILYTYDIKNDDKRLRASVSTFEKQRSDYPVRREFPAFTVTLDGALTPELIEECVETLEEIGFNVE